MAEPKYFDLMFPFEKPGLPKRWIKIGYATQLRGGKIVSTIYSTPLGWNGTFYLFPVTEKKNEFTPDDPDWNPDL